MTLVGFFDDELIVISVHKINGMTDFSIINEVLLCISDYTSFVFHFCLETCERKTFILPADCLTFVYQEIPC